MKAMLLGLAMVLALVAAQSAAADDTAKTKKDTKAKAAQKAKSADSQGLHKEQGTITGSYIPQTVRRNGMITDGQSQVQVIDERSIRATGATDVRQVLNRLGAR